MTNTEHKQNLSPFFYVALGWLLLGVIFCLLPGRAEYLSWLFGLWFLSVFDLFALAKAAQSAINLASGKKDSGMSVSGFLIWGALKMICLGAIIGVLFFAKEVAGSVLVIGVGTLVVVPLFGGAWWFRTEAAGA